MAIESVSRNFSSSFNTLARLSPPTCSLPSAPCPQWSIAYFPVSHRISRPSHHSNVPTLIDFYFIFIRPAPKLYERRRSLFIFFKYPAPHHLFSTESNQYGMPAACALFLHKHFCILLLLLINFGGVAGRNESCALAVDASR